MIANHKIYPKRFSQLLFDTANNSYDTRLVAEYDNFVKLKSVPEKEYTGGLFWREVGRANTSMDEIEFGKPYRPRIMRKIGLLEYLCDYCGVSSERNVAAVIGEMSAYEHKDPISFLNSIKTLGYDK